VQSHPSTEEYEEKQTRFQRLQKGKVRIAAPIMAFGDSHLCNPGFGTNALLLFTAPIKAFQRIERIKLQFAIPTSGLAARLA
jgi:hypothetical protein